MVYYFWFTGGVLFSPLKPLKDLQTQSICAHPRILDFVLFQPLAQFIYAEFSRIHLHFYELKYAFYLTEFWQCVVLAITTKQSFSKEFLHLRIILKLNCHNFTPIIGCRPVLNGLLINYATKIRHFCEYTKYYIIIFQKKVRFFYIAIDFKRK